MNNQPIDSDFLQIGTQPSLQILFEDKAVFAVNKPAGQLFYGPTQGLPTSLAEQVKNFFREQKSTAGAVYLGIVHRLDRPVSGAVIFARNSKFSGRLGIQFSERKVDKRYLAVVSGQQLLDSDEWVDQLPKLESLDVNPGVVQECRLKYRVIKRSGVAALVEVQLLTGRRHQIRRQFSLRGFPIVGDQQYGGPQICCLKDIGDERFRPIALHSYVVKVSHPLTYEILEIVAKLPRFWRNVFIEYGLANSEVGDEVLDAYFS